MGALKQKVWGQTLLIKPGRSSKAKNRGRHFVRKTPLAGNQIAFEPGLGSAFEPNASRRPRRQAQFNTGIAGALDRAGDLDTVDERTRTRLERAVLELLAEQHDSPPVKRIGE